MYVRTDGLDSSDMATSFLDPRLLFEVTVESELLFDGSR
jgi:hypothetical protein